MSGPVSERVVFNDLKDPVLVAAFATPAKAGATAASALSYVIEQWNARPVMEFASEHLYSNARIRPQLVTSETGVRSLQWPANTVYLATPEGTERSILLLVGVEPSFGWQDFADAIHAFCRRNSIPTAILLHSAPATISHRHEAPLTAVYGSDELQSAFGLTPTMFHDGPQSFGSVLSLYLNAEGIKTADIIALEPFYMPGLPDAQAIIALIRTLDRYFGVNTPMQTLLQTAEEQREAYERVISESEQLRALATQLEGRAGTPAMLQEENGRMELSVTDVMNEVDRILTDQ